MQFASHRSTYTNIFFPTNTLNFPYNLLNIFFLLAYFIVEGQHITPPMYKICYQ